AVAASVGSEGPKGLEFLYFGDCGALIEQPGGVKIVGETLDRRAAESVRAAQIAKQMSIPPAAGLSRPAFIAHLRAARNRVNQGGNWLFSPDRRAAAHARRRIVAVAPGAFLL